jgi:hypothetical protein
MDPALLETEKRIHNIVGRYREKINRMQFQEAQPGRAAFLDRNTVANVLGVATYGIGGFLLAELTKTAIARLARSHPGIEVPANAVAGVVYMGVGAVVRRSFNKIAGNTLIVAGAFNTLYAVAKAINLQKLVGVQASPGKAAPAES